VNDYEWQWQEALDGESDRRSGSTRCSRLSVTDEVSAYGGLLSIVIRSRRRGRPPVLGVLSDKNAAFVRCVGAGAAPAKR
jgi:hypothetical protein